MSTITRSSLCFFTAVTLAACTSSNGPGTTSKFIAEPGGQASQDGSQVYVKVADLKVLHSGDLVGQSSSNKVEISGVGKNSTYAVQYKFNSGNNISMRLLTVSTSTMATSTVSSDCSVQAAEVRLKLGDSSQDLPMDVNVNISPNTDYVVEVSAQQTCDSLDLTLDPQVWIGSNPMADPQWARVCEGQHGEHFSLFAVNGLTIYSDAHADEPFVDVSHFCGENVTNIGQAECLTNESSQSAFELSSSCVTDVGADKRGFTMDFNIQTGAGSFSCQKNGTQTYSESMANCQDVILDYAMFTAHTL